MLPPSLCGDRLSVDARAQLMADPSRFDVIATDEDALLALGCTAPVVIRDNGHTEVAAGSLTEVGRLV